MASGLDPRLIEERIRAYDGFGTHRTGWTGDDRSADWMRDALGAAGVKAVIERFTFQLLEYRRMCLHYPGGQLEGLPMYDCGFTPAGGGVEGELVELGSGDPFGNIVITTENDPAFSQARIGKSIEDLEEVGAVGLVIVTADPKDAVTVLNAVRLGDPRSLPVLQVGAADARRHLASALLMHSEVRLDIDGDRLQSRARNVAATLLGTDSEAAPIGVMTPRSGWFTCASERGGGIAILLALAEEFARRPHRRTIELVASSGHELNHVGLESYLRARAGIEKRAHAWLHLGANIGTSTGPTHVETTDAGLLAQGIVALETSGAHFEVTEARGGEAQNIARAGGRYLSLRGGNDYFHSPNDTFDLACDAEQVAAAGRAALTIIEAWDAE
ncbi:MAG: hypothetical protein EXR66_02255 [Dehalococcoidia bacterium]|nr:hypothetical protein [Dehalococcoidia bacterium]